MKNFLINANLHATQNEGSKQTDACGKLHEIFNKQRLYAYNEIKEVPFKNGIYIIFEKSEIYKNYHRIVRVGTHTSQNRLKLRLRDHYIKKNKDGSIFRKNIGKAILNKRNDSYLHNWNQDTSQIPNKHYINANVQSSIEHEVSEYLQKNTFFTVFEVEDPIERLRLENGIIATLNYCADFKKSKDWLGNFSTEVEIRDSGMWLKKGLNGTPLSNGEIELIENLSCN